jgi:hypothetical protein
MIRRVLRRVVLRDPPRIRANLVALHQAGLIDAVPTLSQVGWGVAHMVHRIVFRPDTVGVAPDDAVREGWRARLLEHRVARAPWLLWEDVIHPLELTGLATTNAALRAHVMGAFHPGDQCLYDLAILSAWPGELELLQQELQALLEGRHPRGTWLADLCVYEGYHARVLGLVERALLGDFGAEHEVDADTTLRGYVRFLCSQPATSGDAWAAWREGRLSM